MAASCFGEVSRPVERIKQLAGNIQILLKQNRGSPGIHHGFGIALLVIVGGGGKGNQQAGLAGGGQFGHGGGSATRHHQVRLAKRAGISSRKARTCHRAGSAPLAA